MPKRLLLVLAVVGLAIAACHGSSTTPSPSSSPFSPSPDPKITKATIEVTINGTPRPKIPVEASTPANPESPRPGNPFDTKLTGQKGLVRFHPLKPSKTYCFVAELGSGQTSTECAGWAIWQNGTIILGT